MNLSFGSKAIEEAIVSAGALGPLVVALRTHAKNPEICEYASGALRNIACGSDVAKDAIVSAGAVAVLADVWRTHGGNAKDNAHGALRILGFKDDGTKK